MRDENGVEIRRIDTDRREAPQYLLRAQTCVDQNIGPFAGYEYGVTGRAAA
jgi:hypothetical protein